MAKKIAQVQFTQQQLEQLEDLKRQTGLNRVEFLQRGSTITFPKSVSTVTSRL